MEIKPVFENSEVLAHRAVQVQAGMSLSGNLNLITQEGDRVEIAFGSERSISGSRSQTRSADGSVVERLSLTAIAAQRYSVSVEGALNEDELQAIQQLVRLVDPFAEDFFAGRQLDVGKTAGTLADNLGVVQELSLHLQKTTFAAVSASQFSQGSQAKSGSDLPLPQLLPDLKHIRDFPALVESVLDSVFSRHAAGVLDEAGVVRKFGDFLQFLKERLRSVGDDDSATPAPQTPSASESPDSAA
ncbi:hypothetical protein [Nitrospina watsonii]|uniref:DUF5610 domain-containing protein n=1 Tax=Nitrospina watsonii TaxID=1323948 RepID=A0ABN8W1R1_9BACT|nr:hypothetical protein [Nitrospina watsonii]CAI2719057.1 conserved protein of unknown function [Nitrospina watsonii]